MASPTRTLAGGGIVFVALTLLGWSSIPLFLKYFADYIDAWTANGWRYAIAAIFWAPVLIAGVLRKTLPKHIWKAALVPALFNAAGQSCFAWAPYYIDPGLLTFMLRFNIIFVTIGAFILFPSERLIIRTVGFWVGLIVVFGGLVGVYSLGSQNPTLATIIGATLAVVAGTVFAGYALAVRHFMHNMPSVPAFAAISLYTSAILLVVMVVMADRHGAGVGILTGGQVGILIASALIGIAFGHVFYYASIARLGVTVTSGVVLLQPAFAGIASYFMFDERLTTGQWVCGLSSIGGAVLMLRVQRRVAAAVKQMLEKTATTSQEGAIERSSAELR